MFRPVLIMLFVFLALPLHPAFAASAEPGPRPTVIVSIAPQKYLLERIAGDTVSVVVLVKPGMDPHSYEPSPSQMRESARARAWFTIGVPFEDVWLPRITESAPGLKAISSIKGLKRLPMADDSLPEPRDEKKEAAAVHGHAHEHEQGHSDHGGVAVTTPDGHNHAHGIEDPHVWLSPMLVREMLTGLTRNLAGMFPEHAAEYRSNARKLKDELEALDADLMQRFAKIPEEKRVFLTFHPSWRYYAYNYQLREISIEVDGKEPGPRSMKETVDTARRYGIRAVFVEPQFPKAAAKAIASSIGAKIYEADPLAENLPELYKSMADMLVESFPE